MSRSKPKTLSYSARLVLIGILASLCFSTGEGLRLLPFRAVASTGSQIPGDPTRSAYTPSLPHSSNSLIRSIKLKESPRRYPTAFGAAANCKAMPFPPPTRLLTAFDETGHLTVRPSRASLADRAPPVK